MSQAFQENKKSTQEEVKGRFDRFLKMTFPYIMSKHHLEIIKRILLQRFLQLQPQMFCLEYLYWELKNDKKGGQCIKTASWEGVFHFHILLWCLGKFEVVRTIVEVNGTVGCFVYSVSQLHSSLGSKGTLLTTFFTALQSDWLDWEAYLEGSMTGCATMARATLKITLFSKTNLLRHSNSAIMLMFWWMLWVVPCNELP